MNRCLVSTRAVNIPLLTLHSLGGRAVWRAIAWLGRIECPEGLVLERRQLAAKRNIDMPQPLHFHGVSFWNCTTVQNYTTQKYKTTLRQHGECSKDNTNDKIYQVQDIARAKSCQKPAVVSGCFFNCFVFLWSCDVFLLSFVQGGKKTFFMCERMPQTIWKTLILPNINLII